MVVTILHIGMVIIAGGIHHILPMAGIMIHIIRIGDTLHMDIMEAVFRCTTAWLTDMDLVVDIMGMDVLDRITVAIPL